MDDTYMQWQGKTAYDEEGNDVGTIADLYCDTEDSTPTWATVQSGIFGLQRHFVPISLATVTADGVQFATTKQLINDAPAVKNDEELSEEEEGELFQHYQQLDAATTSSQSVKTSDKTADDSMTLSEERLHIDKEKQVTGRARLRKYVVTKDVHITVPVEREVVTLERTPVAADSTALVGDDQTLSEDEQEVVLTEEKVIVSKQTVPDETVRLKKEKIVENRDVNATVGQEQIEMEDDGKRTNSR